MAGKSHLVLLFLVLHGLVLQVVISDQGLAIGDGLLGILRLDQVMLDFILKTEPFLSKPHVSLHFHHLYCDN